MSEPEHTKLRISNALNDRLKAALAAAHNGMSVTKLAESFLGECLDCVEAGSFPTFPPTISLLRTQAGKTPAVTMNQSQIIDLIDGRFEQLQRVAETPPTYGKRSKG